MASSSSSSPEISTAPSATGSQSAVQYAHLSREEVLEELSSRFILNLPEEELASLERVCFQVEQAHWYYEDFIREQNPAKFPSYSLKTFSEVLFRACPPLQHWAHDHERAFESFMQYKTRVPVCGAIMLNDTWEKCVLVKGWKSSAGWGFPKGKINEQEPRPRCAAREVLEETGFDLEGQIVPEDVIELSIKEQSISLYIVSGVPEDYPFKTRTRKEISKIAWFRLADLPTWKRSKAVPGKFYLISPFIGPLKAFINSRKPRNLQRRPRRSHSMQLPHEPQISSEEDAGTPEACPAVTNDSNTQESSSQSSSADNGEPQTPSPQYSAPRLNHPVQQELLISDHDTAGTLDLTSVDPHFARLLSSLSLSAAASDDTKSELTQQEDRPSQPGSMAAPRTTWESDDHPHSTSVPLDFSQARRKNVPISSPTSSVLHTARSTSTIPTNTAVEPTVSSIAPSNVLHSKSPSFSTSSSVPVRSVTSHPPPVDPAQLPKQSPRLSRARHGSRASADISPYLSRPADISKEMRYISMLENVVKESDRMSQQHPTPISSSLAYSPEKSLQARGIPASVPLSNQVESPIIYSSGPALSRQLPAYEVSLFDPFTVRPHTSVPFHSTLYRPPSRQSAFGAEAHMRYMTPGLESQGLLHFDLRSAGNQSVLPMINTSHQPNLSNISSIPSGPPGAALRVIPPPAAASRFGEPALRSAPAISPTSTFHPTPDPSRTVKNAHLLSILNTPSAAPRTVPIQPSLYTGLGPR